MDECNYCVKSVCRILTDNLCDNPMECPFYKTEERAKADITEHDSRLASLSKDKQDYIARKYYNTRKPWNKPKKREADI